jgi:hypothetical protein
MPRLGADDAEGIPELTDFQRSRAGRYHATLKTHQSAFLDESDDESAPSMCAEASAYARAFSCIL